MFQRDLLIPIAALLIFAFAIVGLLWGDQLGWWAAARQIPSIVWFGLVIVILALQWRFMPRSFRTGRLGWIILIVGLAIAAILGLSNLLGAP